jgi:predicted alpha/beta superfamily hydrolase
MLKFISIFYLSLFSLHASAQYSFRIEISVPAASGNDSIFIAGSFNNWDPHHLSYLFSKSNNKLIFKIDNLSKGIYEYKITRGGWGKVETTKAGLDIENRLMNLSCDTTVYHAVAEWKDNFAVTPKQPTRSRNVQILDTSFRMKKLQRTRRIWIYLPPDYRNSPKKYPVIYMHDGQNLFDQSASGFGEWGVDEALDSLAKTGKSSSIVVGIDNGPRRMNEYNPYYYERSGEGEGDAYLDFIIRELKPYIDKRFRTHTSKEHTIIAGSSMGGLISYYAVLKYPEVFGKAGIFSPSFWVAPQMSQLTDSLAPKLKGMFFFYMGELEGESMVKNMNNITLQLGKFSNALLYTVIDPAGRHTESAWKKWFTAFYLWITSNGFNHIIK